MFVDFCRGNCNVFKFSYNCRQTLSHYMRTCNAVLQWCTGSPIRDPRSGSRSDFSGSGSDLDPIFTPLDRIGSDRIGSTLFVVFPDPIRSKLSQNFNEKLKKFDKNSRAFWLFSWNSTKFCLESTLLINSQFCSLSIKYQFWGFPYHQHFLY